VQARNSEVAEDGEMSTVVVTTKERAPTAPDYVKITSQAETSIAIEWGLPNFLNGVLRSFLVNIEETDSVNVTDCCQYFPIQEVAARYEQASYKLELNNLRPASTYAISIAAKTVTLGPAVSITAHTRPQVPSMEGMLQVTDSSNQAISSKPTVIVHTVSVNKDLFAGCLLVVIPQSTSVEVEQTLVYREWLSQELEHQINGTSYIAAEHNQ
ncbi:hypothetical protein L9F63_023686, partial [Diploptera punctata]